MDLHSDTRCMSALPGALSGSVYGWWAKHSVIWAVVGHVFFV